MTAQHGLETAKTGDRVVIRRADTGEWVAAGRAHIARGVLFVYNPSLFCDPAELLDLNVSRDDVVAIKVNLKTRLIGALVV